MNENQISEKVRAYFVKNGPTSLSSWKKEMRIAALIDKIHENVTVLKKMNGGLENKIGEIEEVQKLLMDVINNSLVTVIRLSITQKDLLSLNNEKAIALYDFYLELAKRYPMRRPNSDDQPSAKIPSYVLIEMINGTILEAKNSLRNSGGIRYVPDRLYEVINYAFLILQNN